MVNHKIFTPYFVTFQQFPATEMHLVQCFSKARMLLLKNCWSCSFSQPFPVHITFSRQNCPVACGDLDPHLIHDFLGPPESTLQTASQAVQLFLQSSRLWQAAQLTDTPCYSVSNNRPHLCSSEMQAKNKLCSIVVKDGTNQSHNINEIYNVRLSG